METHIRAHDPRHFLGNITRGRLYDIVFTDTSSLPAGPFPNVKTFHDTLANFPFHDHDPNDPPHPYRGFLPDDVPVVFTHGDLHRSNIMITPPLKGSSPRVLAIIDWYQSGWFPSYWEYNKTRWTADVGGEWATKYVPLFVDGDEDAYNYWDYFMLKLGV